MYDLLQNGDGLSLLSYVLLALGAYFAGFIDSIAGGGGMITVPVFLLVGIPPHQALATNKLQSSFGSFTAMLRYRKGGLVSFRSAAPGVAFTLVGAVTGALVLQHVDTTFLSYFIPPALLALLIFTLTKKDFGSIETHQRMKPMMFYLIFGLILGFYDGFFGPGTGSFWTAAFIAIAGMNIKTATGHTKVVNFVSNSVALLVFLFGGNILIIPGLMMGACQVAGAWTGSHLVMKKDSRFVKLLFVSVLSASIIYLGWRAYFL